MGKKLEYNYVCDCFKEQGCELLEKEYANSYTKMRYRCSCGNVSKIIFNNFRRGARCNKCGYIKRSGKNRYSLEYIEQCFLKGGCKLLEKEYINRNTKMRYRCSCENISKTTFNRFQQGCRCAKCAGNEKYTLECVEQYFEEQNCKLLEKEYKDNKTLMKYICVCETIDEVAFLAFKKGQRCQKCSKKTKHTYSSVKQYFLDNDCFLLEKEYINCSTKMRYKCSCGNISETTFARFLTGKRCKKCGIEKLRGKNSPNWISDRQVVKENKQFRNKCHIMLRNFYKYTNGTKTDKTANLLGVYS